MRDVARNPGEDRLMKRIVRGVFDLFREFGVTPLQFRRTFREV